MKRWKKLNEWIKNTCNYQNYKINALLFLLLLDFQFFFLRCLASFHLLSLSLQHTLKTQKKRTSEMSAILMMTSRAILRRKTKKNVIMDGEELIVSFVMPGFVIPVAGRKVLFNVIIATGVPVTTVDTLVPVNIRHVKVVSTFASISDATRVIVNIQYIKKRKKRKKSKKK